MFACVFLSSCDLCVRSGWEMCSPPVQELDKDDVSSRVTIKTSDMDEYVQEDSAVSWAFYLRQGGCVFSNIRLIVGWFVATEWISTKIWMGE